MQKRSIYVLLAGLRMNDTGERWKDTMGKDRRIQVEGLKDTSGRIYGRIHGEALYLRTISRGKDE